MILYLALGCALLALIMFLARGRSADNSGDARLVIGPKGKRWIIILVIALVLAVVLLRFGQWHAASIVGGGAILWPLLRSFIMGFLGSKVSEAGAKMSRKQRESAMTADEARDVLGVDKDAGPEEIEKAYKKLMQKNHPDQGGSDYFARKLNEARSLLLDS